jgi:hypothetical protein
MRLRVDLSFESTRSSSVPTAKTKDRTNPTVVLMVRGVRMDLIANCYRCDWERACCCGLEKWLCQEAEVLCKGR